MQSHQAQQQSAQQAWSAFKQQHQLDQLLQQARQTTGKPEPMPLDDAQTIDDIRLHSADIKTYAELDYEPARWVRADES